MYFLCLYWRACEGYVSVSLYLDKGERSESLVSMSTMRGESYVFTIPLLGLTCVSCSTVKSPTLWKMAAHNFSRFHNP